ncbi:MAG: nucleotidyltransferase domain-containing protein [Patescibacteria group bacterium]
MKNAELATAFREIANLLELENANVFRVRAYRAGASVVENLPRPASEFSADELDALPGLGADLVAKILEFVKTGKIKFLVERRKKWPRGFLEILKIPGLGPKTARKFWEKSGIKNLRELEKAAKSGALEKLPGVRARTVANILDGIELIRGHKTERRPFGEAAKIARKIVAKMKKSGTIEKIEIAGSLRRRRPTIGDIDLLATAKNPKKAIDFFAQLDDAQKILGRGTTKSSILLANGMQIDLRIVPAQSFGAALLYFTGNKNHNIFLRKIAIKNGWKLNEYGLFQNSKMLAGKTEKEIYERLGAKFLPPERREF